MLERPLPGGHGGERRLSHLASELRVLQELSHLPREGVPILDDDGPTRRHE